MAKSTILIVDRDTELVRILSTFLLLDGYRVNHVVAVRDAVKKMALQKYSAVLIDPFLSEVERGEEILAAASDPTCLNCRTPFLVFTKNLGYELPESCLYQIKQILKKPFTLDEFYTSFKKLHS